MSTGALNDLLHEIGFIKVNGNQFKFQKGEEGESKAILGNLNALHHAIKVFN